MIPLFISIAIVIAFASQAKKNNKNPIKWGFIGLLSFWVITIIPIYIFIEFIIVNPNNTSGIILINIVIFTFFIFGVIICNKIYKHLKKT